MILSAANLSASDVDNAAATLIFTVSNVANGRFELSSSPGTAITSFTQAEVAAGLVVFVQDGSRGRPELPGDGERRGAERRTAARLPSASAPSAPLVVAGACRPPAVVPVATSAAPASAPAPEATTEAPAAAPARVTPAVFSPGRIDPPEAQLNDLRAPGWPGLRAATNRWPR